MTDALLLLFVDWHGGVGARRRSRGETENLNSSLNFLPDRFAIPVEDQCIAALT
jgi:hypothetical protein